MPDYVRMKSVKNSSSDTTLALAALGGCILVLALLVYGILASGFVLSILWGWFIVSAFKVPALSVPVAIGATVVARMLTGFSVSPKKDKERTQEEKNSALVLSLLMPWLILGMGWIVHLFV